MTKKIAITGAAGQIGYSLLFRIANGDLLGNEPVELSLLDLPGFETALEGLKMELQDCAFPLLKGVRTATVAERAFEDADYVFLVGAKPRGAGMERKELLSQNAAIFAEQGKALNKSAKTQSKILVVGNPCNTNCLIAMHHAPKIPRVNFHAMTKLDENRARAFLAQKSAVSVEEVTNLAIWGNHSNTQAPDFLNAKIQGKPALSVVDETWLKQEFYPLVQKRGAAVIAARGKSSAASAANAAIGAMRDIAIGSSHCSSGVDSSGNPYGVEEGLVFSFPISSLFGEWNFIVGSRIDSFLQEKIFLTQKELIEERDLVKGLLR